MKTTTRPTTADGSMSFYVNASKKITPPQRELAARASQFGDALTLAGPGGPQLLREMRDEGYQRPVLLDAVGYAGRSIDSVRWAAEQTALGVDRVLMPGLYVPWTKDDFGSLLSVVAEERRVAADLEAILLLSIDARWIAYAIDAVIDALACGLPVALVLADGGGPLERKDAAANLRRLVVSHPGTAVLRSDHGGLVAAACGDGHTSIGLSTSTRHFVAAGMSAFKKRDNSPRVFVRPLLDWFKGTDLAGWDAANVPILCHFPCCRGRSLGERYFSGDSAHAAAWHNMHALADFADHILNAPLEDRPSVFREACELAASHYGLAGLRGPIEMKSQLKRWVYS
jgi:hypothetical protein